MNRLTVLFVSALLLLALLAGTGCARKAQTEAVAEAKSEAVKEEAPPLPSDVQSLQELNKPDGASAAGKAPGLSEIGGADSPGSPVAATGELVAPVTSELSMKLPGRVGRMFVDEGQRVRRGQPLLSLETDYLALDVKRAEAEVSRAAAAVADAERDFQRKEGLIAKGSVSQAAYDRSRSSHDAAAAAREAAVAARDLARQRLADAVLRSPIDGLIAEKRTDVGERLGDNSVAFVVVQTSPLKLRFQVPERYLDTLREGQPVRATVDPYPGEVFSGRVSRVIRVVDPETRTIAVETELPNRDGRLYPGLFAKVEIDLSSAGAAQ